jgi:hypothetical protein
MKTATTAVFFLCVIGVLTVACGSDNNPSTPTTPILPSSEVFTGTLAVKGSSFYSFTVAVSGNVSITLASLVPKAPGPAVSAVMGLGVGTPDGTDCAITNSVTTAPGLTAQLVNSLTPATYCTKIYDLGELTAPVDFAVRIVHP